MKFTFEIEPMEVTLPDFSVKYGVPPQRTRLVMDVVVLGEFLRKDLLDFVREAVEAAGYDADGHATLKMEKRGVVSKTIHISFWDRNAETHSTTPGPN